MWPWPLNLLLRTHHLQSQKLSPFLIARIPLPTFLSIVNSQEQHSAGSFHFRKQRLMPRRRLIPFSLITSSVNASLLVPRISANLLSIVRSSAKDQTWFSYSVLLCKRHLTACSHQFFPAKCKNNIHKLLCLCFL